MHRRTRGRGSTVPSVITAGVDLATDPKRTALATIDWAPGNAVVTDLRLGVEDRDIAEAAAGAVKLGLDCPLGWPDDFVKFVNAHHDGHVVAPRDVSGKDWRRRLAYRATDRAVREATGLQPLSVAADRIGLTAMRAAGLLAGLAKAGRPVDRTGSGIVLEVYPAASLYCWRLPYREYKGRDNQSARDLLIRELLGTAPWLDLREHAGARAGSRCRQRRWPR